MLVIKNLLNLRDLANLFSDMTRDSCFFYNYVWALIGGAVFRWPLADGEAMKRFIGK